MWCGRAATAFAFVVAIASGVSAGTTANLERAAGADIYLQSERGVYRVRITGTISVLGTHGGSSRVEVKLSRCAADGCEHDLTRYAASAQPGTLVIADDLSAATLSVEFAGRPLRLTWHRSSDGARTDTTRFATGGPLDFYAEQSAGVAAEARVTVVGQTCATREAFIGAAAEAANPDRGVGVRPIPATVPFALRYRLFCV